MVYRELVALMGERNDALNLAVQPPAVILLAGLQGSGKTTTAGKLARWLKIELKKKVLLASCDVYRPAAIEQLKTLAAQVEAEFFPSAVGEKPVDIARARARPRAQALRRRADRGQRGAARDRRGDDARDRRAARAR